MQNIIKVTSSKSEIDFSVAEGKTVNLIYVGEITPSLEDLPDAVIEQTTSFWPKAEEKETNFFSPVEVQVTGEDTYHKGVKLISADITRRLKFVDYTTKKNSAGKLLVIQQHDNVSGLTVKSNYQLFDNSKTIRAWTEVTNDGKEPLGLEYISSFALTGVVQKGEYGKNWAEHVEISEPSNEWQTELQWDTRFLKERGMNFMSDGNHVEATTKRVAMTNTGSWSCSEFSPNGILFNSFNRQAAMWQVENNGSWHTEVDDTGDGRMIRIELFGPEEFDNQWWKLLAPQETFVTVPVGFAQIAGCREDVIGEMTKYRRLIRRKNDDDKKLPVIFNDYMNCLSGDPTTEKEMPLVHAAARAGAEYFVIDCGWYDAGYWWDSVGEWKESRERFPNGVREVTDEIRRLGMVPGLWLEIEVMGINCPLAKKLPDDWFFMRHGKRAIDVNRYHLDFRNPAVREYASKVISRLVNEYGLGYIKMDYNIITGVGTETDSDSLGDGLLEHNRAYLQWIDEMFVKYPDLVIENCGSGGMRHDYAMLSRHSIQSMTDQTEYVRNGQIAATSATAVTPEQTAIWSYPLSQGDDEEAIYNMVNTMLVRIHQSGYLNELTPERFDMVQEGIRVYKSYRDEIPVSMPVWPTKVPHIDDDFVTFGLLNQSHMYLGVWNSSDSAQKIEVDFEKYGAEIAVKQIYPEEESKVRLIKKGTHVSFDFPAGKMARLYYVRLNYSRKED